MRGVTSVGSVARFPALAMTCCVIMGKSGDFSVPQPSQL